MGDICCVRAPAPCGAATLAQFNRNALRKRRFAGGEANAQPRQVGTLGEANGTRQTLAKSGTGGPSSISGAGGLPLRIDFAVALVPGRKIKKTENDAASALRASLDKLHRRPRLADSTVKRL